MIEKNQWFGILNPCGSCSTREPLRQQKWGDKIMLTCGNCNAARRWASDFAGPHPFLDIPDMPADKYIPPAQPTDPTTAT